MFQKLTTAIEPFALTLIIISGASLAGWINFSNEEVVGIAVVFFGILLTLKHIVSQIKNPTKKGN